MHPETTLTNATPPTDDLDDGRDVLKIILIALGFWTAVIVGTLGLFHLSDLYGATTILKFAVCAFAVVIVAYMLAADD